MTDRELILCIVAMIAAMLAFVSIVLIARPAHGSAVCLTKHEARQLWPKKHLYWYSADHCWSNRRGGPPSGVKYDLIRENHAEEKGLPAPPDKNPAVKDAGKADRAVDPPTRRGTVPTNVVKIVRAQDYNELDAQADADTFFNAKPFTYQQYVLNLDNYRATYWYRQIWGLARESK